MKFWMECYKAQLWTKPPPALKAAGGRYLLTRSVLVAFAYLDKNLYINNGII